MKGLATIFLILFACFLAGNPLFGQVKKGRELLARMAYAEALEVFERAMKKGGSEEAKMGMANAWFGLGDMLQAGQWYSRVATSGIFKPEEMLQYGRTLMAAGDYKEARNWFLKYAESPGKPELGRKLAASSAKAESLRADSAGFKISRMSFNSEWSEISPVFYKQGLVIASNRPHGSFIRKTSETDNQQFFDLYYIENLRSGGGNPEYMRGKINSSLHDGPVCFTKAQHIAYITRSTKGTGRRTRDAEGVRNLQIFKSEMIANKWKTAAPFTFNNPNYSTAHPALSQNEEWLFFSSDMPGGMGGKDLYACQKKGKDWGEPQNLGPDINTKADEVFPFLHPDGTLFFASDGHPGLGGLDIFAAEGLGGLRFEKPENLGHPLNSSLDDFGIIWESGGNGGYFCSNRGGIRTGDDIYRFTFKRAVKIMVVNARDRSPLKAAKLQVSEKGGGKGQLKAGTNGTFRYFPSNDSAEVMLSLQSEGYNQQEVMVRPEGLGKHEDLKVRFNMTERGDYASPQVVETNASQSGNPQTVPLNEESFEFTAGLEEAFIEQNTGLPKPEEPEDPIWSTEPDPPAFPADPPLTPNDPDPIRPNDPFNQNTPYSPPDDWKEKMKEEIRADLRIEMQQMILEMLGNQQGPRSEIDLNALREQTKADLEADLRKELRAEVITQLREELREEVKADLRRELRKEIEQELRAEIGKELKREINDYIDDKYLGETDPEPEEEEISEPVETDWEIKQEPEPEEEEISQPAETDWELKQEPEPFFPDKLEPSPETYPDIPKITGSLSNEKKQSVATFLTQNKGYPVLEGKVRTENGMSLNPAGMMAYLTENGREEVHSLTANSYGKFHLALLPGRQYELRLEKKGYKSQRKSFSTSGQQLLIPLSFTFAPVKMNQVYPVANIHYDEGAYYIRRDALKPLKQLSRFLKDNPALSVEIRSHTDTRGGEASNLLLSKKRAEAAVSFLKYLGVSPSRMAATGMGSQHPLVDCRSKQCSETDHQRNRRTEFKIVGINRSGTKNRDTGLVPDLNEAADFKDFDPDQGFQPLEDTETGSVVDFKNDGKSYDPNPSPLDSPFTDFSADGGADQVLEETGDANANSTPPDEGSPRSNEFDPSTLPPNPLRDDSGKEQDGSDDGPKTSFGNGNTGDTGSKPKANTQFASPDGVTFRVQIGLFRQGSGTVYTYNLREYTPAMEVIHDGMLVRYLVGDYPSYEEAEVVRDILRKRGYHEAMVIAFKDNQRIPLPEKR